MITKERTKICKTNTIFCFSVPLFLAARDSSCFIWPSASETLSHLLFLSPSSLWHSTSKQQLGITEAINDHFPAHLPPLFWQLLNDKHMIYWHTLDSNVHKFNFLPLKDRLIQFSSAFLQARESRTATGRGAIKTPSWILIWISLELWIVLPMKLTGEKNPWLNLLKSCNSFWEIALASCSANLVFVFMRTLSMHPQATILMSGWHMLFIWFRSHWSCRQFNIQQRIGPEGKEISYRLGTTSSTLQKLTSISRGALLKQGIQAGSDGMVHF